MSRKTKRLLLKSIYIFLFIILSLGVFSAGYFAGIGVFGISVVVDENDIEQTFRGFGSSSAWTFQEIGLMEESKQDKAIEMLYLKQGLDLNVIRYNIGAGSKESIFDNVFPYNNGYFDYSRRADSFFISEKFDGDYSVFADETNYDFSKDFATRSLLKKAIINGDIDKVVLFANSPHYLMTSSGIAIGEYEYQENLKPECFHSFSDYLLIIAKNLYTMDIEPFEDDVEVFISPVNEPQWKWGGSEASQEGCHYEPKTLAAFYEIFYDKLNSFNESNGTNFKLEMFESGNYIVDLKNKSRVEEYIDEFKKYDYFTEIEELSFHSYATNTSTIRRSAFYNYLGSDLPKKDIVISEYCDLNAGVDEGIKKGLYTGNVILKDLSLINAVEWSWWLAISDLNYEDGLLYNKDNEEDFSVTKRYFVFGHFSKYIDKGDVRVKIKDTDILNISGVNALAVKKQTGEFVLVLINNSYTNIKIKLDVPYGTMKYILTDESNNWYLEERDYSGQFSLPKLSITTIVLSN